jgi:23S rRNA-intervening sequence protein
MGPSSRDLIAWQKAMDFVMDVYRTSKGFPRDDFTVLPASYGER